MRSTLPRCQQLLQTCYGMLPEPLSALPSLELSADRINWVRMSRQARELDFVFGGIPVLRE